jgi:hypothetical protein
MIWVRKRAIALCPRKAFAKVAAMENTTYHEIDFLLPAQRFNINFSYITEKGLPFVREFVLRLVHLAPLTKSQVVAFFGFSKKEADEVISDLVERDELTLSEDECERAALWQRCTRRDGGDIRVAGAVICGMVTAFYKVAADSSPMRYRCLST